MEMYQSAVDGQWESLLECSQQSLMRHESVCNYVAMAHAHSMKVRPSLKSHGAKSMLAALGKRAGSDLYLLHVNLAVKVWPYVRVPGLATKSSPGLMPHPLSHPCERRICSRAVGFVE